MRIAPRTLVAVSLLLPLAVPAHAQAARPGRTGAAPRASVRPSVRAVADDASLRAFLASLERATDAFINGDAAAWRRLVSPGGDASIVGGWGGVERGQREVAARYDWAAARFVASGAAVAVEYLAGSVSGDLAYTVAIERSRARVVGRDSAAPMALRVTHVFRREGGAWKLLHRHADPLVARTAPDAVLRPPAP